jgi:hypothetical protein
MRTLVIRNNTSEEKIWLKTFTANEEYTVPSDNSLAIKYSVLDSLLIAISNGEASIGNGVQFFTTVNEQINWLKNEDNTPKDSDGSPLQRVKVTTTGWHYQLHGVEFETSKIDSVYSKKVDGTNYGFSTMKFYKDASGVETEITGEDLNQAYLDANCIKTVMDWEATHDLEIIGGFLKQLSTPSDDVRLWVVGVPDVSEAYGGSKPFVVNVNLKYIGLEEGVRVDGRAPKYMTYSATYHTNKIRMMFRHAAGTKRKLSMIFELFKA